MNRERMNAPKIDQIWHNRHTIEEYEGIRLFVFTNTKPVSCSNSFKY